MAEVVGELTSPRPSAPSDPWSVRPPRPDLPLAHRPVAGTGLRLTVVVVVGAVPALRLLALGRPAWALQLLCGVLVLALPVFLRRAVRPRALPFVAVAAVAGAVPAAGGMGRSPVLVAAAGVVATLAVADGWWSPPGWYRRGPVATLAVPFLALGAISWYRSGSVLMVSAGYLAAMAVVALGGRRAAAVTRADAAVAAGITVVATAVARFVVLVVALPVLYLPGALVAAARGFLRRSPAPAGWRSTAVDAGGADRRPFAPTSRAVARRRHALGLSVLAGSVVIALAVLLWPFGPGPPAAPSAAAPPRSEGLVLAVPFTERPAFRGQLEVRALEAEQRRLAGSLVADPATRTRVPDFEGRTTNVVDGIRRTVRSSCDGCPRVRMWLVGGSAAFGLGQRDEATIASRLVELAARDGIDLEVVNLAAPGWTGWQEAAAVREKLGELEAPDVVVVYDGFNDVLGTVIGTVVNGPGADGGRPVISAEDISELTGDWRPLSGAGDPVTVGRRAAEQHATARAAIRADAERVGAEAVFVVQPDALVTETQRRVAGQVVDGRLLPDLGYLDTALGAAATTMEADGAWNLRRSLDGERDAVFGDLVHSNERGAAVVAAALYQRLRPMLTERAGTG